MYGSDRLERLEVYVGFGLSKTIIRRPEQSGVIYEDPCNDPGRELSIVFTRVRRIPARLTRVPYLILHLDLDASQVPSPLQSINEKIIDELIAEV